MIANPDLVKTLTVQKLKYNLRYQNKRLLLRGSKVELVQRLSWVLYARCVLCFFREWKLRDAGWTIWRC